MERTARTLPSARVGDPERLNAALDRLQEIAGVKTVDCDTKFRDGRVIAWSLWCGSSHAKKGDRQPYVGLNNKPLSDPSAIPTYDVAAEKLIANIEEKHGCCLAAAEDAKRREHTADSARADGSPDIQTQNAFERMQAGARLAAAREVAAKANTAALAAEQEREAAEAEVAALERALDPKRQRVEEEEEEEPAAMASDWSFADHRREMTRVMNRRAVEPVAAPAREPRELQRGKHGYLHHPRVGLVGAVAYWACGSLGLVVTMLVALIVHLICCVGSTNDFGARMCQF
jgi:hypothetical protein